MVVVVPPPRRPRLPAAVRAAAPLQKATAAGADHAAARRDDRSRTGGVVGCCEGEGAATTAAPGCACRPSSLLAGGFWPSGLGGLLLTGGRSFTSPAHVCAAGLLLRHWQTGYYRAAVAAAATRRLQHF